MILSKSWTLILGLLAGALAALVVLSSAAYNHAVAKQREQAVQRDVFEFELWMRTDAGARLDALSEVAKDDAVRDTLAELNGRTNLSELDGNARGKLEGRLGKLNNTMLKEHPGDVVSAVDSKGFVVAQIGGKQIKSGQKFPESKALQRGLKGFPSDDVLKYGGQAYRLAFYPVVVKGDYVGVVVHGMRFDKRFASTIADRIAGTSIAFLQGSGVTAEKAAASMADINVAEAAKAAQQAAASAPGEIGPLGYIHHQETPPAVVAIAPIKGSAETSDMSVALLRPKPVVEAPWGILTRLPGRIPDMALKWGGAALFAGVLFGLLGLLFIRLERDQPLKRMLKVLQLGTSDQPVTEIDLAPYKGLLYRVAGEVNVALSRLNEKAKQASTTGGANLDDILGPAPSGADAMASNFSFPPPPSVAPADEASQPAALPWTQESSSPALEKKAPPAPPKPPTPPQSKPEPTQQTVADEHTATAQPNASDEGAPTAKSLATVLEAEDQEEDDATVVRDVNATLVAKTEISETPDFAKLRAAEAKKPAIPSPAAKPGLGVKKPAAIKAPAKAEATSAQDEIRAVFEKFVATKKECGESTSSLDFDRFAKTLQKNIDTIKSQHGAKDVKFTVYVKEGKAALKAVPVKA